MTVLMNPLTLQPDVEAILRTSISGILNMARASRGKDLIASKRQAISRQFGFSPSSTNDEDIINETITKIKSFGGQMGPQKTISYEIPTNAQFHPVEIRAIGSMRDISLKEVNGSPAEFGKLDLVTKPNPMELENPPASSSLLGFVENGGYCVAGFTASSFASAGLEDAIRKWAKDWYNKTENSEKITQWAGVGASGATAYILMLVAQYFDRDTENADAILLGGTIATAIRAFSILLPDFLAKMQLVSKPSPTKPLAGLTKTDLDRLNQNKKLSRLDRVLAARKPRQIQGITEKTEITEQQPTSLPMVW